MSILWHNLTPIQPYHKMTWQCSAVRLSNLQNERGFLI